MTVLYFYTRFSWHYAYSVQRRSIRGKQVQSRQSEPQAEVQLSKREPLQVLRKAAKRVSQVRLVSDLFS